MQYSSIFSLSTLVAIFVLLLSSSHLTHGKPYDDDNNYLYSDEDYTDLDSTDDPIYKLPKFVTKRKNVIVDEGSTIRLPCVVDKLEGFVLLWKRGNEILAVGEQVITQDNKRRLKLINEADGAFLVISNAEEKDAGKYVCQISTYKPRELEHTVKIRVYHSTIP